MAAGGGDLEGARRVKSDRRLSACLQRRGEIGRIRRRHRQRARALLDLEHRFDDRLLKRAKPWRHLGTQRARNLRRLAGRGKAIVLVERGTARGYLIGKGEDFFG